MEENEKTTTVEAMALKHGLIIGLALVIYTLFVQVTGLVFNQSMGYLIYPILIGLLIYAFNDFKSENDGFMSLSQGIGIGSLATIIGGLIGTIASILYINFVDTTFVANMKDFMRTTFEKQYPDFSDEQIEQMLSFTDWAFNPTYMIVGSLIFYGLIGLILSLIVAAIMKKSKPMF